MKSDVTFRALQTFDREHSDSHLWYQVMKENELRKVSGRMSSIPNSARKQTQEAHNKKQRTLASETDLETCAMNMFIRICHEKDVQTMYFAIAGANSSNGGGAPLFADMARDLPLGALNTKIKGTKSTGGNHPLGPEWALNALREDNLPLLAGLIDADGQRIEIAEEQGRWQSYCGPNYEFIYPDIVKDNGHGFVVASSPHVKTPFQLSLPFEVHGTLRPADCLLELYFDLYKERDPIIAQSRVRKLPDGVPDTFKSFTAETLSAVMTMMRAQDAVSEEITKAIAATDLMADDSLDMSPQERARLRCYGAYASKDEDGNSASLEPLESVKEMSIKVNRLHAIVHEFKKNAEREIQEVMENTARGLTGKSKHFWRDCYKQPKAMKDELSKKLKQYKRALVDLALKMYEATFQSKQQREAIPGGWKCIFDQFVTEVSKLGQCGLSTQSQEDRRRFGVHPNDPNASAGTISMGFALDISLIPQTTEIASGQKSSNWFNQTAWGEYQTFKMWLWSDVAGIEGRETRLMTDIYNQVFECVNKKFSTIQIQFGKAGTAKSVKVKRFKKMMPAGIVIDSGDGSEKAGRNGGFDEMCGRMVYFDEATQEMSATQNGPRLEYIKQKLSDNSVQITRSVKVVGSDGTESWKTVRIFTFRFDTDLLSTNLGPMFFHGDDEPSDSRGPLITRTQAGLAFNTTDSGSPMSDQEFEAGLVKYAPSLQRLRVTTLAVLNILLLMQDMPWMSPNLEWAKALFTELDTCLHNEFNYSPPDSRKCSKRDYTLLVYTVEERFLQKCGFRQTSIDYPDMMPDSDGFLESFSWLQLTDVITTLHPSFEVVFAAWSHGLDYNPATASHTFHVMTQVAEAHGISINMRKMTAYSNIDAETGRPIAEQPVQGDNVDQRRNAEAAKSASQEEEDEEPEAGYAEPMEVEDEAEAAAAQQRDCNIDANRDLAPAVQQNNRQRSRAAPQAGVEMSIDALAVRMTMLMAGDKGLEMEELRKELELAEHRRIVKLNFMRYCLTRPSNTARPTSFDFSQHSELKKILEGCPMALPGRDYTPSANESRDYLFPDFSDVMLAGYAMQPLKAWLQGESIKPLESDVEPRFGVSTAIQTNWSFKQTNSSAQPSAANFDPSWRVILHVKNSITDEKGREKRWLSAAGNILSCDGDFSTIIKDDFGLSKTAIRDILFQIGSDNQRLIQVCDSSDLPIEQGYDEAMRQFEKQDDNGEGQKVGENNRPLNMRPRTAGAFAVAGSAAKRCELQDRHKKCGIPPSLAQRRLDHLINVGSLPAVQPILGARTSRGAVLHMDPARGMVVNSSALIAHSRLLTEMAMRVAKIPQLKNYHGGINNRVPRIFHSGAVVNAGTRTAQKNNAVPSSDHDDSIESRTQAAERERERSPLSALSDQQEVGEASNTQIIGVSPGSPQLNASVTRPDAATVMAPVPEPGISNQTILSDEKAPYHYLGWSYDMNVIALSYWMMDRFAFDCDELLKFYKQKFANVFTGTVAEEMDKLPCMTTRFCHYLDTKCPATGDNFVRAREHCTPLLYKMKSKTSFYKDSNPDQARTTDEIEAMRRHVSRVNGRDLDINSPEIQQHLATRGRNRVVQGTRENLYSFKCWWNHAIFALQQSGGIESEQDPLAYVILDSACAFRLRVRQDIATNKGDDEESSEMNALLQPKVPNGQNPLHDIVERNKRTLEFAQAVQDSRMVEMVSQGADPSVLKIRTKRHRAEAQPAQAVPNAFAIPVDGAAGPSGYGAQGAGY